MNHSNSSEARKSQFIGWVGAAIMTAIALLMSC